MHKKENEELETDAVQGDVEGKDEKKKEKVDFAHPYSKDDYLERQSFSSSQCGSRRESISSMLCDYRPPEGEITQLENGRITKILRRIGTGDRTPPKGAEVHIHYEGRRKFGDIFDTSRDQPHPRVFQIGDGTVVPGWDVAVQTMKVGELAYFIFKPEFGFGNGGHHGFKIPRNAKLHYEIELMSYTDLPRIPVYERHLKVCKYTITKGKGYDYPGDLSTLVVDLTGRVQGSEEPFMELKKGKLFLGDDHVPNGLAEALIQTKKQETLKVWIDPEFGFGEKGLSKQENSSVILKDVPPNSHLEYDITVYDFNVQPDLEKFSLKRKINFCTTVKDFGNRVFKKGHLDRAKRQYETVIEWLAETTAPQESPDLFRLQKLLVDVYTNMATCEFLEKKYDEAILFACKALKLDASHVRARFKRAQAYAYKGDPEEAFYDLKKVREQLSAREERVVGVDPDVVEKLWVNVRAKFTVIEAKRHQTYGGFFHLPQVKLGGLNLSEEKGRMAQKLADQLRDLTKEFETRYNVEVPNALDDYEPGPIDSAPAQEREIQRFRAHLEKACLAEVEARKLGPNRPQKSITQQLREAFELEDRRKGRNKMEEEARMMERVERKLREEDAEAKRRAAILAERAKAKEAARAKRAHEELFRTRAAMEDVQEEKAEEEDAEDRSAAAEPKPADGPDEAAASGAAVESPVAQNGNQDQTGKHGEAAAGAGVSNVLMAAVAKARQSAESGVVAALPDLVVPAHGATGDEPEKSAEKPSEKPTGTQKQKDSARPASGKNTRVGQKNGSQKSGSDQKSGSGSQKSGNRKPSGKGSQKGSQKKWRPKQAE